ncbi:hypothetical protein T01_13784 [Trichinella spiralis]|uniref:Uncharacterized protein n=1 Tax=Trichinella spiralis TaxID=6334 RepID=A0A0V1BJ60_TRISP|nr:hypothetical protein T01_13784 [Trichinella spiralis]
MSLSCISLHRQVDFLNENQRRNEEYIMLQIGGASNDYAYCVLGLSQTSRFSQTVDCDDV